MMIDRGPTSVGATLRKAGVLLGAIAVSTISAVAIGVLVPSAGAVAAEISPIDAGSIEFSNIVDSTTPMKVGENSRVSFNWSLDGLQPVAGDTFSMTLPLNFHAASGTIDMAVGGGADSAGTCTVIPSTVAVGSQLVCELSDYVSTHDNVGGSLWLEVETWTSTTDRNVEVMLGDNPVIVQLPFDGVLPIDYGHAPTGPGKYAYWANPERTAITWYVDVPGSFAGAANPLVIEDTFASGLTLDLNSASARSIGADDAAWSIHNWTRVNDAQWSYVSTGAQSFTATLQQPIAQDRVYRFTYTTTINYPDNVTVGDTFHNVAVINGTERSQTITYNTIGGGTAGGNDRGGFIVAKEAIEGSGSALVPANVEYQVNAEITEPLGTPRDVQLNLTAGGPTDGVSNLPAGTTVHLSEITPAAIAGVHWDTPRFSANANPNVTVAADGSTVDLVIIEGGTYRFSLVNTAVVIPAAPTFALGDYTWVDTNANGVQDAGEPAIAGVVVSLRDAAGNPAHDAEGEVVTPVTTDAEGRYHFDGLPAGTYVVAFGLPGGYAFTTPHAALLVGAGSVADRATGLSNVITLGEGLGNTAASEPSDGVLAQFIDRTVDAGFVFVVTPDIDVPGTVSIHKDDGRTVVEPGSETTYVLTATNNSQHPAKDVVVTDLLPANVDLVSTSELGVVSLDNPLAIEWNLGDLAAGATTSIRVTVRIHLNLPGNTEVINTATVTTQGICVGDAVNVCESTDIDYTPAGALTPPGPDPTQPRENGPTCSQNAECVSGAGLAVTGTNSGGAALPLGIGLLALILGAACLALTRRVRGSR